VITIAKLRLGKRRPDHHTIASLGPVGECRMRRYDHSAPIGAPNARNQNDRSTRGQRWRDPQNHGGVMRRHVHAAPQSSVMLDRAQWHALSALDLDVPGIALEREP
jgi:hypothetical protein